MPSSLRMAFGMQAAEPAPAAMTAEADLVEEAAEAEAALADGEVSTFCWHVHMPISTGNESLFVDIPCCHKDVSQGN